MKKHTYRIRNWSEYNASLKQRGSLTIWVSSEAVANWTTDELTGQSGASPTYTDLTIETMATVQAAYLSARTGEPESPGEILGLHAIDEPQPAPTAP